MFTPEDWLALVGSLLSSLALVDIGYEHVLDGSGTLGFLVCWYLVFMLVYGTVVSIANPRPIVVERLVTVDALPCRGRRHRGAGEHRRLHVRQGVARAHPCQLLSRTTWPESARRHR